MLLTKKNKWSYFEYIFKKIDFEYKSVNYNKVLAFDILIAIYNEKSINNKSYLSIVKFFFAAINLDNIFSAFSKKKLVAINKTKRIDYCELFDSALSDVKNFEYFELSDQGYKFKINLLIIYKSLFNFFSIYKLGLGFKRTLYITSKLCFYISVHNDILKKVKNNPPLEDKKLLTFNSAISFENLLTQVLNNEVNYKTYSLTHEVLFGNYKLQIPLNKINGFNITSQKVLVWGKYSMDDLILNFGVKKNKIIIAGNPKYSLKNINIKKDFKSCLVILPRDIYHKSNLKLINLLNEASSILKFKVSIKLHPSLVNFKEYNFVSKEFNFELIDKSRTLTNCLQSKDYDFSLGYNTNAYYESLYHDMFFFRYQNPENEMFKGLNDKFNTTKDLVSLIEKIKNIEHSQLNNDIQKVLKHSLGIGINKYSEILN
jgi:hypothetical protein